MITIKYDKVESTNIIAKEMAYNGAEHGTVVMANEQTAGKGQINRPFFSPPDHGIYMSIILDVNIMNLEAPQMLTIYAAMTVCEAIEELCGKNPKIKWVNDIFLEGKKICGISADAISDKNGNISHIVAGIGINFTAAQLPAELEDIVTSIYKKNEKASVTRDELAGCIIKKITQPVQSKEKLINAYRQRLFIIGKKIKVERVKNPFEAIALDIDEHGHLVVRDMENNIIVLNAGEVSTRTVTPCF